ncbi:MAG TPA: tetratricopeptide repeat protein [Xanthobacteraceae bacterium]|nr:tetratricopeptide repeat protein [Xanthobacteraceae bacterium]
MEGTFPSHTGTWGVHGLGTPSSYELHARVEINGQNVLYTSAEGRFAARFDGSATMSGARALCEGEITNTRRQTITRAYYAGSKLIIVHGGTANFAAGACRGSDELDDTFGITIDRTGCRFSYTQRHKRGGADRFVTIVDQPCTVTLPNAPAVAGPPASPPPASPRSQQTWNDCAGQDADRVVAACTSIIADLHASAQDRADAHLYRAAAALAAGDLDSAIADYTHAIELTPQNVVAYASRAVADIRKGDRAAAIADFHRADGIDHAKLAEMVGTSAELGEIAQAARRP